MKHAQVAFGDAWRLYCLELARHAATPGGQRLCEHLQPIWEILQLQQYQLQVQEMQALLDHSDLPRALAHQPGSTQWLKRLNGQQSVTSLLTFFDSLHSWRKLLQHHARESPQLLKLGQALQPESKLAEALQQPNPPKTLWQQVQKKASAWQEQEALLDQLDALVAKARLARGLASAVWPRQSNQLNLLGWQPPLLDQLAPFDLVLPPQCRVVLLSGAHQSGKSRLLQSLYLAVLAHQSGLALPCTPGSSLPVFVRLQWLEAGQTLDQRLKQLKPWLQVRTQAQLLLVDDFLTHSSPGEHQALGLAVIQQLKANPQGLSILSCHDRGLIQKASRWPEVTVLGLQREGPRHKARLQLNLGKDYGSSLLLQAREAQWPSQVLQAAETEMQQLKASLPVVKVPVVAPPKPAAPRSTTPPLQPIHRDVPVGARVYLPQLKQYGDLLSSPDRKNRVSVSCEGKTFQVPADQVVLSSHRKEKKGDTGGLSIQTWSVASEACDLHGMRVDEALPLMEKFLDTAAHQGLPQVRIIHGKGTSALQRAVQARLRELQQQTDYIVSYRFGLPGEGDTGLTVVRLQK